MELSNDYIVKINREIEVVIEQYKISTVSDLVDKFNINSSAKNSLNMLTRRLIAYSSSEILTSLNDEVDFCFKTIKLDRSGILKESMSLPTFKYCNVANETWESSELREYFLNKVFAFTVFKDIDKNLYLYKIVLWKMPDDILNSSIQCIWKSVQDNLLSGRIVKYIDERGRYFSYFPSSSDNPYIHVRPHAKNRKDTYPLPVADRLTGLVQYPKHSFWINRAFVLKIIERNEYGG